MVIGLVQVKCEHCGSTKADEEARAQNIMEEVARSHGVTVDQITGRLRYRHIVDARACAAWRLTYEMDCGQKLVGYYLGRRDHSTVHNLLKVAEKLPGHRLSKLAASAVLCP